MIRGILATQIFFDTILKKHNAVNHNNPPWVVANISKKTVHIKFVWKILWTLHKYNQNKKNPIQKEFLLLIFGQKYGKEPMLY